MSENTHQHDVIYLEADSEITEAIDKLKASHSSEVRIAVPARSPLLQSAVNLKLLKRTAHTLSKKIILISNDKATLSLAAGIGLMVAKNVNAQGYIPEAAVFPSEKDMEPIVIEQEVGEMTGRNKKSKKSKSSDSFKKQHISFDGDNPEEDNPQNEPLNTPKNLNRGPKIPNYLGLNKKIGVAIAVVVGLILLVLAYSFLPTSKVTLLTKAQKTPINVKFQLDSTTRNSSYTQGIIAANKLSMSKDLSAQYTATGKKDIGTKSNGSVTIDNCDDTSSHSLPAGSKLTASGKTFITNNTVTIPAGTAGGGVVICPSLSHVVVGITALESGDSYNLPSTIFSLSGFSSHYRVVGSTGGGTSQVVTVVTQADIDKAKNEMINTASQNAKQDVESKASNDEKVFPETFSSEVASVNTTSAVDSQSSGGTVSAKVSYTELSATNSDLDKLFSEQIKTQIPGNNQIYQSGYTDSKYAAKADSPTQASVQAVGFAYYGQSIDTSQVARALRGKTKKDATSIVSAKYPQVTEALVDNSLPLAPNLPFIASRIKVEIKVNTD
ncbi:MAG: hypothetical protein WCH00_01665 [Candidatus Saccharibacteria bacterium]